jgi:hypothetical protein
MLNMGYSTTSLRGSSLISKPRCSGHIIKAPSYTAVPRYKGQTMLSMGTLLLIQANFWVPCLYVIKRFYCIVPNYTRLLIPVLCNNSKCLMFCPGNPSSQHLEVFRRQTLCIIYNIWCLRSDR